MSALTEEVTSVLRSLVASSYLGELQNAEAAALQPWVASDVQPRAPGLPSVAVTAFVAASQLAHCLERMGAAGLHVPANVLQWYQPGGPLLQPRLGYRPPDATVHACIRYEVCALFGEKTLTFSYSAGLDCGRWVVE